MVRIRWRRAAASVLAVAALCATSACAGGEVSETPVASGEDGRIILQLAEIALRDSGIETSITETACWKPTDSMVEGDTFRVLCRLRFSEAGDERYRDMICIGVLSRDPVAEYCYPWAFYSDMPKYEDHTGFVGS